MAIRLSAEDCRKLQPRFVHPDSVMTDYKRPGSRYAADDVSFACEQNYLALSAADIDYHQHLIMSDHHNLLAMKCRKRLGKSHMSGSAVYVLADRRSSLTKIGKAICPATRLSGHRSSNPFVYLKALLWSPDYDKTGWIESRLLWLADDAGIERKGEWLETTPETAALLALTAARHAQAKVADSQTMISNIALRGIAASKDRDNVRYS